MAQRRFPRRALQEAQRRKWVELTDAAWPRRYARRFNPLFPLLQDGKRPGWFFVVVSPRHASHPPVRPDERDDGSQALPWGNVRGNISPPVSDWGVSWTCLPCRCNALCIFLPFVSSFFGGNMLATRPLSPPHEAARAKTRDSGKKERECVKCRAIMSTLSTLF